MKYVNNEKPLICISIFAQYYLDEHVQDVEIVGTCNMHRGHEKYPQDVNRNMWMEGSILET
jgi:hypothetical protein